MAKKGGKLCENYRVFVLSLRNGKSYLISLPMKIKIPVSTHVFKFITSPEMLGDKFPLTVRKDSLLGVLIIMIATKGPVELNEYYNDRLAPAAIDLEVRYLVIETKFPLREEFLLEEHLLYVSNALELLFNHFVIFFSMGYVARMGSERGAIRLLYERFGMEDDPVKQESLRAICKRNRNKVIDNYKGSVKKRKPNRAKKEPNLSN